MAKLTLKDFIQNTLIKLTGYYLQKQEKSEGHVDCERTIQALLKYHQPKCLYDIGAHEGAWTAVLHRMGDTLNEVVFFEPQKNCVEQIKKLSLANLSTRFFPVALGASQAETLLLGGTSSASVLPISEVKSKDYTGVWREEEEEVVVERLDDLVSIHHLSLPDTIKIDVQGYELDVLQGAVNTLKSCRYLIVELSFDEFYVGQPRNWEVLKFLDDHHFRLIDFGFLWRKGYQDNQRIIQADGIFLNESIVDR